jgi:hypothetical protein
MKLHALLLNFILAFFISAVATPVVGAAYFGVSMIPKNTKSTLLMGVNVEVWRPDIIEELFKDNEFLKYAFNADEYVLNGAVVHIPQSGGPASVERNRSSLPATIVSRGDTDVNYVLDEYTTDPVRIPNTEEVETSYDKSQSVISENMANLKEVAADNMLYRWSENVDATRKLKTTGAASTAGAPGATGTRLAFTEADLRAAQVRLNNDKVPKADRYLLLPDHMANQLRIDLKDKYYYKDVVNLPEGVITKLYGFYIMERSQVLITDASDVVKLPEAASAITDNQAALFWQKSMVERAMGTVNMFESLQDPQNYGDIYSFLVRMGGRARRTDNAGVGLIIADAA